MLVSLKSLTEKPSVRSSQAVEGKFIRQSGGKGQYGHAGN